jgi:transposase
MVIFGIDAHKRTHTVVAIDDAGRNIGHVTTSATTTEDHLRLVRWSDQFGSERRWAVEDCRHLSRRLEADLLRAGEAIVRVPPKLMCETRSAGRSTGKSDPIDALAVARAAWRYPDLPAAVLDDQTRELRLLVDHREDLVGERTRCVNRLRWHLHELDPSWDPPSRSLGRISTIDQVAGRLAGQAGMVAEIAAEITAHVRALTVRIDELTRTITKAVTPLAPTLLAIVGIGPLGAAKILGETADVRRFRNKDAYARHNGTAPRPAWSGNPNRFRLSRAGNRQINAALHRAAITQGQWHPDAQAYLERRRAMGNTRLEAIRVLKRRLSDVVFAALLADARLLHEHPDQAAA